MVKDLREIKEITVNGNYEDLSQEDRDFYWKEYEKRN